MTNWKLAVNWWTQQSLGFDFCLKRDALTGTSISDVAERRKVTTSRRSRVISLKIWHRFHDIYIYVYTICVRHTKANRWANKEKNRERVYEISDAVFIVRIIMPRKSMVWLAVLRSVLGQSFENVFFFQ